MKYVYLHPPGTLCLYHAILHEILNNQFSSFLEIGPGQGFLSEILCKKGLYGIGIESSQISLNLLNKRMQNFVNKDQYKILNQNVMEMKNDFSVDIAISVMVMEHIKNDYLFLENIKALVRDNGMVLIAVPGRMDKWGIEDEIYGHFRRYEKKELFEMMNNVGMKDVKVSSIGVPVSNMLFNIGNFLTRNSGVQKREKYNKDEQTNLSSVIEVKGKTYFPSIFKILLNNYTMLPFVQLQKVFYRTEYGLTLLGVGRV